MFWCFIMAIIIVLSRDKFQIDIFIEIDIFMPFIHCFIRTILTLIILSNEFQSNVWFFCSVHGVLRFTNMFEFYTETFVVWKPVKYIFYFKPFCVHTFYGNTMILNTFTQQDYYDRRHSRAQPVAQLQHWYPRTSNSAHFDVTPLISEST